MVYTPTAWVNDAAPPINAANLGKIEAALQTLFDPTTRPLNLITDFGADPTGATNSDAAVVAWATSGGNLYAPEGNYLVNGTTRPRLDKNNTRMLGDGPGRTRFLCSEIDLNRELFIVGSAVGAQLNNITISGVSFEFTAVNTTRGTGNTLRISRVNNLTVEGFAIYGGDYGLNLNRAHGFTIRGGEVSYTKADGIQCNNGSDALDMTLKDGLIYGNHVHHTGDDGIAVGGTQDGGVNRSQPERISIYGNNIHDLSTSGGAIGVYGLNGGEVYGNTMRDITSSRFMAVRLDPNQYPTANVHVHDNIGSNTGTRSANGDVGGRHCISLGSANSALTGSELDIPFCENIRIENNDFTVTDRSGLWCQPPATMSSHPNKHLKNIKIINNTFRYAGPVSGASSSVYQGMHLQWCDDVEVRSNRVEGFPHRGVTIRNFVGLRWTKNEVSECVADSAYAAQDMVIIGDTALATDTIIDASGNSYRKTSGTTTRLLNIKATGSTTYPHYGNAFYPTGATISTAVTTTDGKDLSGVSVDASGHLSAAVMPASLRIFELGRRSGALAESFSRAGATLANNAALVSGQQLLVAVPLVAGQVLTKVTFVSATTPLSAGTNQWFSLYDGSLGKLRVTNDDGATAWAANAEKQLTLASSYTVTTDGLFFIGCMVNATTPPSLIGVSSTAAMLGFTPRLSFRDSTNTGLTTPATAPTTVAVSTTGFAAWAWVG